MECPNKSCGYYQHDDCILTFTFEDYEIKMICKDPPNYPIASIYKEEKE